MRNSKWAIVLAMLVAGSAAAQSPAPVAVPAQGPPPGAGAQKRSLEAQMRQRVSSPKERHARMDLGAWWKNSEVVREIGLTEQQRTQIEQTFFDHRLKLIDLKAAVEREETRLQPLMEADQVNEAQISTQIDKVLSARGALEKANVMMMLSIRKVLTVEQWKKLEEVRHQRDQHFKMRMPAPPPPAEMEDHPMAYVPHEG